MCSFLFEVVYTGLECIKCREKCIVKRMCFILHIVSMCFDLSENKLRQYSKLFKRGWGKE